MNIKLKGFITNKKSENYSDCADNYAINTATHKFAISDGVSRSFFPKYWSKIIVENFVNSDSLEKNEAIAECQIQWLEKIQLIINQPETKYYTRNAYIRKDPALATFASLQFFEFEKKCRAQAQGDSFIFFVNKNSKEIDFKLSSKPEPLEFDNFPDYLSSIGNSHKGKIQIKERPLVEGTFYLMTDALSEWFMNHTEDAIDKLSNIQSQEQFLDTIEDERANDRLNDDDTAVLIIEVCEDGNNNFSYSENNIVLLENLIEEERHRKTKEEEEIKKKQIYSLESVENSGQDKNDEIKIKEQNEANSDMNVEDSNIPEPAQDEAALTTTEGFNQGNKEVDNTATVTEGESSDFQSPNQPIDSITSKF